MEHPERIITLTFFRKDFEDIYFRNKQSNIFLSAIVRRELILFLILLFALIGTIVYSLITNKSAWLIVVFSILSVLTFIPYYSKASNIQRWRRSVIEFLNKNAKFKSNRLILNEETLTLVQDNNEDIHKWSAFTHIEIAESYLMLTGTVQYFFPKKSMQPDDYDYFIQAIKTHVKNGL